MGPRHDSAAYQWSYLLDEVGALTRLINILRMGPKLGITR